MRTRLDPRLTLEAALVVAALALADPTLTSLVMGGVIALLGFMFRVAAAGYGYQQGQVAMRGPYRLVRHPYLMGTALICCGLVVAARNPWLMGVALVALAGVYRLVLRKDEQTIARYLGPKYAEYCALVPSLVPRLWPLQGMTDPGGASFSFENAMLTGERRELEPLVGLLLIFGCLLLGYWQSGVRWLNPAAAVLVALYLLGRFFYSGRSRRAERRTAAA